MYQWFNPCNKNCSAEVLQDMWWQAATAVSRSAGSHYHQLPKYTLMSLCPSTVQKDNGHIGKLTVRTHESNNQQSVHKHRTNYYTMWCVYRVLTMKLVLWSGVDYTAPCLVNTQMSTQVTRFRSEWSVDALPELLSNSAVVKPYPTHTCRSCSGWWHAQPRLQYMRYNSHKQNNWPLNNSNIYHSTWNK